MKLRHLTLLSLSLIAACGREGFVDEKPEALVFDDFAAPSSVVQAGRLVVEAEAATTASGFARKSGGDASANAYMASPRDADEAGVLRFTIDIATADEYVVWVRGRGASKSEDSVYVRFDGGSKQTVHVPSKSWVWRAIGDDRKLGTGRHTVDVIVRESGVEVDQLLITANGDEEPSGILGGGTPAPNEPEEPTEPEEPSEPTEPTQPTEPTEPEEPTPGPLAVPADLLDLTNWKITLPTGANEKPTEVKQPALDSFSVTPYFLLNSAQDGVVFRAHAGGVTTSGSSYPRSELREMKNNGTANADWSSTSGTHTLTVVEAITHTPEKKPHVVAAQIHDASDDVIMVRLEGKHLFVEGGGEDLGTLDANYTLGTKFAVRLTASGGVLRVYFNDMGTPKVSVNRSVNGCYFKAGAYTQSNTSKGDASSAYGEVIIYDLDLQHQ